LREYYRLGFPELIIILFALASPFLLWPVEFVFPYPHIVEEFYKVLIVFYILTNENIRNRRYWLALLFGVFFALSETVFYATNFLMIGKGSFLAQRLILTGSMHTITTFVILISALFGRKMLFFGFLMAVLIHFVFNSYVVVF
jgi:RsiW-degrading membrane proteinase PrsW (M82 family)